MSIPAEGVQGQGDSGWEELTTSESRVARLLEWLVINVKNMHGAVVPEKIQMINNGESM